MNTTNKTNGGDGPNLMSRLARSLRWDGWSNVLTGLGLASRDKLESSEFLPHAMLSPERLEALYRQDDIAARICDKLPNAMLRKGFEVTISGESDGTQVEDINRTESAILKRARELKVVERFIEGMTWGRLFGGAAILVGAKDGADREGMAEPLKENQIQTIESLTVIDKRFLEIVDWYDDPTEKLYGEPKIYRLTPTMNPRKAEEHLLVHHTRLIVFYGTKATIQQRIELDGWSDSVLQRPNKVLRDFNVGWQACAHLFTDAAQAVFKIKGLIDQISKGKTETILQRIRLVDMNRSIARALAIDADGEEFERQPYNFGNVDKVLQMFMLRMSAAADMPVTLLMGQSPAGLNATGENDTRAWYDSIADERKTALVPKLERMIELIMLAKDSPTKGRVPDTWGISFPSLWQPTLKEETEIRKNMAETDQKYHDMGVLLSDEIALSRFPATGYSIESTIDIELREQSLEADKARAQASLNEPREDQTEVQSYIFDKSRFASSATVTSWLQEHQAHAGKIDETETTWRARQSNPENYEDGSFRTIDIASGIQAVIGKPKA